MKERRRRECVVLFPSPIVVVKLITFTETRLVSNKFDLAPSLLHDPSGGPQALRSPIPTNCHIKFSLSSVARNLGTPFVSQFSRGWFWVAGGRRTLRGNLGEGLTLSFVRSTCRSGIL